TPEKDYVGTPDAVTVKRVDKNGTPVTARYTATVTATPKAMTTETTGKQGQVQEGTLTFPGSDAGVTYPANSTPVFDNGTTVKEVPNVGKFELDAQGKVTFTPEKQFVGESPAVEISRTDDQGVVHKTTYKATVAAVTPTGSDATSTGQQGQVQMGRPEFTAGDPSVPLDDTVAATFDDGSQRKEVPNVGVFTVASDGTVTFTPEKDYVGTPDAVTVKRVDKNGTPVTARYTATVTVPATGKDVISVGNKGQAQMAKPVFEGSIDDKVRPTFEDGTTEKTISGEGTYSIDPDGIVTFTPDSNFVGTGKGVVVKRVDTNGNAVLANYAPTVIGTASAKNDTTTGAKGQTQTSSSLFSGDIDLAVLPTFEDGTTEKVVLGEGVYRLDPNGIVTFTPDPNFVGQAKGVTVVRKDRNGNTISATYTPTTTESAMTPERNTASVQLSAIDKNIGQNSSHQVSNMSMNGEKLPNTGTKDDSMLGAAALTSIAGISLLGLARRKKASEE
ncbi:MAG: LPXTG cell wall anchor domain-containing protein, partial [Streptococcus sp.]|nr:LPXTG cell wall anchor domain-containing protein [Streptococcus sp.]